MRIFESSRPELRVFANYDSEMQRFESCRPSQRVRSLRVNKRMSLKTARDHDRFGYGCRSRRGTDR
jgi:hypothetical protein